MDGRLLAISDLHVAHGRNRDLVMDLRPASPDDWLIVAGDVAERIDDLAWALGLLRDRFARVVWTPGNHELWTTRADGDALRGEVRYKQLIAVARDLGVDTPEDPYPVWEGEGGPVTVAPLFLLYDYSFRPEGTTKAEALDAAWESGVVCTDEALLHPDPHPGPDAWCRARVELTERRLAAFDPGHRLVLVNHFPLIQEPTRVLRHQQFALWCGTQRTVDWHTRFNVAAVVYGHLHIRRTTWHDGVPFMEVSVGYPREWVARANYPGARQVLPVRKG